MSLRSKFTNGFIPVCNRYVLRLPDVTAFVPFSCWGTCPSVPHLGYTTIVQVGDSAVTISTIERYTFFLPFCALDCTIWHLLHSLFNLFLQYHNKFQEINRSDSFANAFLQSRVLQLHPTFVDDLIIWQPQPLL